MPIVGQSSQIFSATQLGVGVVNSSGIFDGTIVDADISVSAAIAYAKMQNVSATQLILGRNTAGAGVIEEVTINQFLDWVSGVANGDILVRTGGVWGKVSPSTAGQFLTSNGAGVAPSYQNGGDAQAAGTGTQDTDFAIVGRILFPTTTTAPGWTLTSVTGSLYEAGGSHTLSPTSSSNMEMTTGLMGNAGNQNASYAVAKTFRAKWRSRLDDTADRKGQGFCITPVNLETAETDITNGLAAFVWNAGVLWARNANGSTATNTDISAGITATNWNTYEIVVTPGTDIKFYVNGTLKATHTTNLPTSGTPVFGFATNANGRPHHVTEPVFSFQS